MSILTLTKENFTKEVLQSSVPVAVDFMAQWCGPCKQMEPIVDAVAVALGDASMRVGKLDVDSDHELAQHYQIMSVPTILVFRGKNVIAQIAGVHTKKDLLIKLQELIA